LPEWYRRARSGRATPAAAWIENCLGFVAGDSQARPGQAPGAATFAARKIATSSGFGEISSYRQARQVQIGAKLIF
jgi:hypothetical protein